MLWTGSSLVAWGMGSGSGGVTGIGVSFNPATQTWDTVESAPLDPVAFSEGTQGSQVAVWADDEIHVWTGWIGTDWDAPITRVAAYDPSKNSWRELEPAPIPAQGHWHEPIIWTGSQLITYTDPILTYTP